MDTEQGIINRSEQRSHTEGEVLDTIIDELSSVRDRLVNELMAKVPDIVDKHIRAHALKLLRNMKVEN
jgi:hypothetical protein